MKDCNKLTLPPSAASAAIVYHWLSEKEDSFFTMQEMLRATAFRRVGFISAINNLVDTGYVKYEKDKHMFNFEILK